MGGKRWTEDDDIYLEYFVLQNDTPIKEAAEFLGRTWGATCTRLTFLRNKNGSVHYIKKRWTKREDIFIKNNYKALSNQELAESLSRSSEAVKSRKKSLKLRKIARITEKSEEIKALIGKGYYRNEIAKKINVNPKSLSTFLRVNDIYCPAVPQKIRTQKLKKTIMGEWANSKGSKNPK